MSSWLFFSGLFWRTLLWGLAISVIAKSLVNVAIEPIPPNPQLASLEGQIFPFPPGRLAVTHAEHWHDGWPDYTEGLLGKIAVTLGAFIEKFIEYDNVELILWSSIWGLILLPVVAGTINQLKEDLKFDYIGVGLLLAGGISNQAEIALFGHATDFLFLRASESSRSFIVANCADVMIFAGVFLLCIWAPLYKKFKAYQRAKVGQAPR